MLKISCTQKVDIMDKKKHKIEKETTKKMDIEELIEKRTEARKNRDFKTADEIRDKLKDMGIVLEDTAQGVKWHRE